MVVVSGGLNRLWSVLVPFESSVTLKHLFFSSNCYFFIPQVLLQLISCLLIRTSSSIAFICGLQSLKQAMMCDFPLFLTLRKTAWPRTCRRLALSSWQSGTSSPDETGTALVGLGGVCRYCKCHSYNFNWRVNA